MDDKHQNTASDAAASRKRRSSILKNQRAPRTPLSELEFTVATPTDTSKNRRVSFSRRMGVAEFVTHECTTTWKNFYEEHNKSLESSNNESEVNSGHPPIGHIGNRIFDQQFQEVEEVDLVGTLTPGLHNSLEFTQQIASLDTSNSKLTAPQNNFDLSLLTDHQTKIFGNDFTAPSLGGMSARIDVDFSTIQKMGIENDDLDEIQKDIQRASNNDVCHRSIINQNMSEYIEIDLNMTHVAVHNDDSDMSITNTIDIPKVQDISKSCSIDKKVHVNKDWVADKENIVINPYTVPQESANFALNEEPDKVLVFDGKKLTLESEIDKDTNFRQTLLPKLSYAPQRKTIVLNVNDDLPNFVETNLSKIPISGSNDINSSLVHNNELSMTTYLNTSLTSNRKTILDNISNLSITQALPSNIIAATGNRKSVIFDGNMSVTHALSAQIITNTPKMLKHDNHSSNISVTPAVPSSNTFNNANEGPQTAVFDDIMSNISITQGLPTNIITNTARRKTVLYEDDDGNISMTQALPANIILPETKEKRRTILFENNNMSVTQSLPTNVILSKTDGKRQTIHYDDDSGNISVTQAIPSNIILQEKREPYKPDVDYKTKDLSFTQILPINIISTDSEICRKELHQNDSVNISSIQAIPTNIIQGYNSETNIINNNEPMVEKENIVKRKTVVLEDNNGDISMMQTLPLNILLDKRHSGQNSHRNLNETLECKGKSIKEHNTIAHMDIIEISKNKTMLFEDEVNEIEMTVVKEKEAELPVTEITNNRNHSKEIDKHRSIIFENTGNVLMAKPIPVDLVTIQNNTVKADFEVSCISVQDTANQDVFVYQAVTHSALKLQQKRTDQGDSKTENPELASNSDVKSTENLDDDPKPSKDFVKDDNKIDNQNSKDIMKDNKSNTSEQKTSLASMDIDKHKVDGIHKGNLENGQVDTKQSILNVLLDMSSPSADDIENKNNKGDLENGQIATKQSILNALLDMSSLSADGIEDKNTMAKIESNPSVVNTAKDLHDASSHSLLVRNDSEEASQINVKHNETVKLGNFSQPYEAEYKEEHSIHDLKKQPSELRAHSENQSPLKNRHYEKVLSSDLNKTESNENIEKSHIRNKSLKIANDTRELLDIISNFTDKTHHEDEKTRTEPMIKTADNKGAAFEQKALSFTPNQRSEVLSRENLINNISMVHAALQKSEVDLYDEDVTEVTLDSPVEHLKRTVRMDNEVVKTLHFEDESLSDSSIKSGTKMSPLKKTAFGETSYMRENKAKVIPTYLKDVSDGIKELMLDLVKPMADVLPFEAAGLDKSMKKSTSTCSTQIQANLITSSQIDIDSELYSNAESCYNMSIKSPTKTVSVSEKSFEVEMANSHAKKVPITQSVPGEVLVFDHNNPLNNIHLGPIDYKNVHKYNPNTSDEKMLSERSSVKFNLATDREFEVERVSMQYAVGRLSHAMEGDACSDIPVMPTTISHINKTMSMDQSIDVKVLEVKDTEVNTLIAMKGNKELLQASSSLTLVDDAITNAVFDADIETKISSHEIEIENNTISMSPVKVIYNIEDQVPEKLGADEPVDTINAKTRKRNYSPSKRHKHLTSVDITPKPNTKIQKRSNSPNVFKAALDMNHASERTLQLLAAGHDITEMEIDKEDRKEFKKSPKKSKNNKPNTSLTVHRVLTDYPKEENSKMRKRDMKMDITRSNLSSIDPMAQSDVDDCKSLDVISSFASSKMNEVNVSSGTTMATGSSTVTSRIDWHPELINEMSSKNLVTECESGVNVVAKIDMLPFMGSHECAWESSSVDTWSFRLLHSRLRLTVRLAHRHDNATRTRVRADTCVRELDVQTVREDKKNPVAALCVRFAGEALRYVCARLSRGGHARAGDVPALLRRAAAVARVALRWGRAMHDARMHLAYTLDSEGYFALKVANIPLRSVWEVTMRIELVVADARETPWPRAGGVRVARVVSDVRVDEAHVRRALDAVPHDWGHAPRTVWKVFRYLKNKTRDDEVVLGTL